MLREEFIDPLGFRQREFARKIGVTHTRLNQVVQDKRSITAVTALRLARTLDTTPRFWMNLLIRFDLDVAEDQHGKKIEAEVQLI